MTAYEVLVIGGGPAGLSASLYLARYNRRVGLFDAGQGRSTWHQTAHNYLGFPGGIPTRQLRELGYQQLREYQQVEINNHKVESLEQANGGFIARGQAGEWFGQAVILCTGVVDHYPHFDDWHEYVGRSMFWCITCDGYACTGNRVVVLGNTKQAASEAMQLQRFSPDITVLTDSHDYAIPPKFEARLKAANIPIIHDKIAKVQGSNGQLEMIHTMSGAAIPCDQIFSQQGATPQNKLALDLGIKVSASGYIETDVEQQTSVPGVYAAGDVTRLFAHQISTAVHEGGQAASAANYYLYPPELKDD